MNNDKIEAALAKVYEALAELEAVGGALPAPPENPACSFCGKRKTEVRGMAAGPQVFICNECVDRCVEILRTGEKA